MLRHIKYHITVIMIHIVTLATLKNHSKYQQALPLSTARATTGTPTKKSHATTTATTTTASTPTTPTPTRRKLTKQRTRRRWRRRTGNTSKIITIIITQHPQPQYVFHCFWASILIYDHYTFNTFIIDASSSFKNHPSLVSFFFEQPRIKNAANSNMHHNLWTSSCMSVSYPCRFVEPTGLNTKVWESEWFEQSWGCIYS